jgi:hypothetical protein
MITPTDFELYTNLSCRVGVQPCQLLMPTGGEADLYLGVYTSFRFARFLFVYTRT